MKVPLYESCLNCMKLQLRKVINKEHRTYIGECDDYDLMFEFPYRPDDCSSISYFVDIIKVLVSDFSLCTKEDNY